MSKINVIGLGSVGCKVASVFKKYNQYNVFTIDDSEKCDFSIERKTNIEDYDADIPTFKALKTLTGETYLVICGVEKIALSSLGVLRQFENTKPNIIYIRPDLSLESEQRKALERIVSSILQQYSRSGKIGYMYMIANTCIEKAFGDLPIKGYYQKINEILADTFHNIKFCENTESVMDTFSDIGEAKRIVTIGWIQEDFTEQLFYNLNVKETMEIGELKEKLQIGKSETRYFFSMPEDKLTSGSPFFNQLRQHLRSKNTDDDSCTYGIYESPFNEQVGYVAIYTSSIQKQ